MLKNPNPNDFSHLTELELMRLLWDKWEEAWDAVTCLECRATQENPVHLKFHPIHCAHVLSKGSMVAARNDVRNIVPMCIRHHKQMDDGLGPLTRKDLKVWPFLRDIIDELKREYS